MTGRLATQAALLALGLALAGCGEGQDQAWNGAAGGTGYGQNTTNMPPDRANLPMGGGGAGPGQAPYQGPGQAPYGQAPTPNGGGMPGGGMPGGWTPGQPASQMPDVVPAVAQAAQIAGQMCQSGQQQACPPAQYFAGMASGLTQDYQACQQGAQQACQSYMQHAQQAYQGMQRFMAESGGGQMGGGPMGGGPMGGGPMGGQTPYAQQ